MGLISQFITKYRKSITLLVLILCIFCALLSTQVATNYNMTDYLPENAQSTAALTLMSQEFDQEIPNINIMISHVTLPQALEYKEKLSQIKGLSSILWLDDIMSLREPLEMADPHMVHTYYQGETALFTAAVREGYEVDVVNAIYDLIGESNALSGEAVNTASMQLMSSTESMGAIAILLPIILAILLLTTGSWLEPFLFLLAIGVSVLLNLGTNYFLGEISYITKAVSPILQMAVSLDYAIFLLHAFSENRKENQSPAKAMQAAMQQAFPSIAASAATTFFGFMALMFMKFRIGPDLGLNLVKGIMFSYLSVMLFLPALVLCCCGLMDRTKHRLLIPFPKNIGRSLLKPRISALILLLLLILPCYLAQSKTDFFYGTGEAAADSRFGIDAAKIDRIFGSTTSIVILVPTGEPGKELLLCEELKDVKHITGVMSYVSSIGSTIPPTYLPKDLISNFYSPNYARIILNADTAAEGAEAFACVKAVREKTATYYDTYYTLGQSANLYDMKEVISSDTKIVNFIAITAIALVLFLTFKSILLPFLLLMIIESAIWINLSVPYFTGSSLFYIGYLVINTVQLGATIDYAILLSGNYLKLRSQLPKKEAMESTLHESFPSILTSSAILISAGFCLVLSTSNPIVSALGLLLGRGTILSMLSVLCVLPVLLLLFDRMIAKTTYHSHFIMGNNHP